MGFKEIILNNIFIIIIVFALILVLTRDNLRKWRIKRRR